MKLLRSLKTKHIYSEIKNMKPLKIIIIILLSLVFGMIFIPNFTLTYMMSDLSSEERIMNKNNTGLILLDRNNKVFFTFYQVKNKTHIPLSKVPLHMQKAIIASEDREFYKHNGYSLRGIIRSVVANTVSGDVKYGGSTITQQLVKNVLLNNEKNILRKYNEIFLASEIEKRYSKDKILEMYLNSVYFGRGAFGIENAAKEYFGKSAGDLSLSESSMLVGILPSPSIFTENKEGIEDIKKAQKRVLISMMEMKFITEDQMRVSDHEQLNFRESNNNININAPHFAIMVRDELINKYGEEQIARSGFKVKTTLNLDYQDYAETVVGNQVNNLRANRVTNGAAVVMDPKSGEVLALVGSYDWNDNNFGKVNVTTSLRQPGSSFKPIIYSAAFEKSLITPSTILDDRNKTFAGNYSPKNYDGQFRGNVTVRRALSNSLNVPAVEVMSKVGVLPAIEMAKRLGFTTFQDTSNYGLSLVLGAGEVKLIELTNAYGTFANEGYYNKPQFILEILDKYEKQIYTYNAHPKQVIKNEYAFLVSSILSDNNSRKEIFGDTLKINRPAAVKTGTTENYKDALTVGYTPDLVVGAWVGNNDGAPMDNIAGSLGAAPIWKQLIEKFSEKLPVKSFTPPDGIVSRSMCGFSTKDSRLLFYNYNEYYAKGTEPQSDCNIPDNDESKKFRNIPKKFRDLLKIPIRRRNEDQQLNIDQVVE